MDRFPEELDLEQRFRNNQIATQKEFLDQLGQVYDFVNGNIGKGVFNNMVLPALLKIHRTDIKAAGLEALAVLYTASSRPSHEVAPFLEGWVAGRTANIIPNSPDLESRTLNSSEEIELPSTPIPIGIYSNDSQFGSVPANWSPLVYKSSALNQSRKLFVTKVISNREPSIEKVIGAKSAQIIGGVYPVGYCGEIDGNKFDTQNGDDPLVISHGVLSELHFKHNSDKEYGFLYMVTSQGTTIAVRRGDKDAIHAVTAVFAVLPRQYYEGIVRNQFRDVERFILNMLPDQWKRYLTEIGFFSKPTVIGRIDAQSPYLDHI